MTNTAKQVAEMIDILPESDKQFAFEIIKNWFLHGTPIIQRLLPMKPLISNRLKKIMKTVIIIPMMKSTGTSLFN